MLRVGVPIRRGAGLEGSISFKTLHQFIVDEIPVSFSVLEKIESYNLY